MKKVVYSVKKVGKVRVDQLSGIGYITNEDLITSGISKNGKSFIRIFEDCLRYLHQIPHKDNEYKGTIYEMHDLPIETKNGSIEYREFTLEYEIWYKVID